MTRAPVPVVTARFGIIALLGAALLAFGLWLGHATSAAPATAAAATTAPARAVARPARAPTLVHPVAPDLAADLHDANPRVRRAAIVELAHSDASDPTTLLAASRDGDLGVAVAATEGLGTLYRDGRIAASDLAVRITDHALAEKVRVTAMNGLGVVASQDGAALFRDLIVRGDPTERRSAAILLQHQDAALAVPALIGALGDADEVVRADAAESLRHFARGRDFGQDAAAWSSWWQSRQG
jgi:HEAT repeat protein